MRIKPIFTKIDQENFTATGLNKNQTQIYQKINQITKKSWEYLCIYIYIYIYTYKYIYIYIYINSLKPPIYRGLRFLKTHRWGQDHDFLVKGGGCLV